RSAGFVFLESGSSNPSSRLLIVSAALCLLLTVACSSSNTSVAINRSNDREITDDSGRPVPLPSHIDRILTLAPNLTEIVYAVGAGNPLVGNTTYCDFPSEAKNVEKVGDT